MEIKTSYSQGQAEALSPTATTTCKPCKDPNIVPIFPVRIAFADIYGELENTEYPSSISSLQSLTGVEQKKGYSLRMLREGYVYIYDELNDVWSIFQYKPEMNSTGKTETFTKMTWQNGPDGEWTETNEFNLETVYVPDSTDEIWIAFSEHRWSQNIFAKAQGNENGFRDNVMTKLNVLDPKSSPYSDELEQIATYIEDFSSDGLAHPHDEWNMLSELSLKPRQPETLLNSSAITRANSPAILAALHDPVGVVKEITMAHTNKVLAKNQYLESITYPLTTAHAVDTFITSADENLRRPNLTSTERDRFQEWKESVNPEYKSFIQEAEINAQECDNALNAILNTWSAYYQMGESNPASTPGSLQTHLTTFNLAQPTQSEIAELVNYASQIVYSIGSSVPGQSYLRNNIVSEQAWNKDSNVIGQILLIATNVLQGINMTMEQVRKTSEAASSLMTDLAMPFSLEIVEMKRLELFQQVNRFQGYFTKKQLVEVDIPISNAIHEITNGSTRPVQSTQRIRRGHTIHNIQTPTRMYKFDGTMHVSRSEAYNDLSHRAGSAAIAGFAIFANALNIAVLTQPQERDQLQDRMGRLSNSKTALILASIEGVSKVVALPSNYALQPMGKSYSVRGQLRGNQIKRLVSGNNLTDDFIKTITHKGQLSKVPTPPASSIANQLLRTVVKIGNIAGALLSFLDILKAYEAYKRGDNAAAASIAAMGLGALTVTTAIAAGLSATATGIGIAIGIALLLTGFILSWFVDDPVTRWLKNGFWGNTEKYLYWDGKKRLNISDDAEILNQVDAQVFLAHSPNEDYDIPRYFEREMQEYYELIYWPQKAPPPEQITGTREVGIWPFNRTTTLTDTNRKITTIRFRLPGFIDGLSNLDIKKVTAWVEYEGVHRRYKNRYYPLDVTNVFFHNLRVINAETGLLESIIDYSPSYNNDQKTLNDLYWDIKAVFFSTGWSFAPTSNIKVPIYYDDYLWSDGWEVEGEGGQKVLRIL